MSKLLRLCATISTVSFDAYLHFRSLRSKFALDFIRKAITWWPCVLCKYRNSSCESNTWNFIWAASSVPDDNIFVSTIPQLAPKWVLADCNVNAFVTSKELNLSSSCTSTLNIHYQFQLCGYVVTSPSHDLLRKSFFHATRTELTWLEIVLPAELWLSSNVYI